MSELLYEFGRIVFMAIAIGLFAWFVMGLRKPRELAPRTTCRHCGYDVRETPDRCPECGTGVPDELRLRIELLSGNLPPYLQSDEQALPLREPEADERFMPLVILPENAQYDRLLTLLARAGIAAEGGLQLAPMHTPEIRLMRGYEPHKPRFQVAVPERDFTVAAELADHVRREGEGEDARS